MDIFQIKKEIHLKLDAEEFKNGSTKTDENISNIE